MFIIPYIDIIPNFPSYNYPVYIKNTIGKLKYELDINTIINKLHKNQSFVDYINASNYTFIPFNNYYSQEVANYFDIYGGSFNVLVDDIEYLIKIYFYKLKQNELISKDIINKFKLIFQYDYFVKNNILNMTWHYYSLNVNFINNLNKKPFLDLTFNTNYTNTKLFNHQKNNILRMLNIHHNSTVFQISDNMPIYFENDLIFDVCSKQFINNSDIPTFKVNSGMIIDEPGTGKTLQFILYILETKLKALVLVPNDAIKCVWIDEFNKHININMPFDKYFNILTYIELKQNINTDINYLNQYQIIGIDEIHNLYRDKSSLFDKIVSSNIIYRWGITGTPFITDTSLFFIIKFLTGYNFKNERIANSPTLQNQFINLFLKNCKVDMLDEYIWPELNIHDIKVKLDIVQQNLYNAESMLNKNTMNLRKVVCEINLMFDNGDFRTPSELKQYGINHYKKLYKNELLKLDELKLQLQNINVHQKDFEQLEYINRVKHFNYLIEKQTNETETCRKVAEYFLNSIEEINKIIIENNDDNFCKICWNNYSSPITYIKTCGHYYCKSCIDTWKYTNNQCPMCRKKINNDDIINVQEICDINNSSKIHELIKIIGDDSYIIFTQFNKVIDKIQSVLSRNNITSSTLDKYNNTCKVLLLSSEQNAEGINLSKFDKMIIFEPFENNIYNNQVEKQLIARIHRIGRVKPVDIYRFITEGTIEEEIYKEFS